MTTEFETPGAMASRLLFANDGWEQKKVELAWDADPMSDYMVLHVYTWHDNDVNEETGELVSPAGWVHALTFGTGQLPILMEFLDGQKKRGRIK